MKICPTCIKETVDPHICNPDDQASATYMLENSTPCPTCRTSFSKVDGCLDMYCVVCFTKFNYMTGRKIFHAIHNPHIPQTSTLALNDCNPVDIPPYDMRRMPITHPFEQAISFIAHEYFVCCRGLQEIDDYVSDVTTQQNIHSEIARNIANGGTEAQLRRNLIQYHNNSKTYVAFRPYLDNLKKTLIDATWFFTENITTADQITTNDSPMATAINHSLLALQLFKSETFTAFSHDRCINRISMPSFIRLFNVVNRIPPQYLEWKTPP